MYRHGAMLHNGDRILCLFSSFYLQNPHHLPPSFCSTRLAMSPWNWFFTPPGIHLPLPLTTKNPPLALYSADRLAYYPDLPKLLFANFITDFLRGEENPCSGSSYFRIPESKKQKQMVCHRRGFYQNSSKPPPPRLLPLDSSIQLSRCTWRSKRES